jgi:pilus assembly protein FimV
VAAAGTYTVQRGDTLSRIATRQYGEGDATRGMIAIYRANPQAFAGNINLLQAGATLNLPDQQALSSVSRAEALTEVRAQMAAWRSASESGPAETVEARLRLVPPGGNAGTGTGSSEGEGGSGGAAPATREGPLSVESPDLARLQGGDAPAAAGTATQPGEDAEAAVEGESSEAAAEPAPAEEPAPEQVAPPAPAAEPEAAKGPGLLDRLLAYWYIPVGILALIAALMALVAARRRREAASSFAPLGDSFDEVAPPSGRDTASDTFPLRKVADGRDSNILVEESSGLHSVGNLRRETQTVDLEETAGAATLGATSLEQGDPLSEADFHMAYGLYDQAADLVKAALDREPERRDLKLKLLEVFFVWGNKDPFLQTARDLARTRDTAPPGEWEKVIIMGKQLAPEDVLFHQSAGNAPQTSVDLNLEGGQNLVDFDLPADNAGDGVDINLGDETSTLKPLEEEAGLDFTFDEEPLRGLDDAPTATTRQMVQPELESITGPTVEQPALDIEDTLAGKLDAHAFSSAPDQTAELAIDDLGLDLGKLESTGTGMSPPDSEEDASADAPTQLVAGLDDTSFNQFSSADASQRTEMLPLTDLDLGGTGTDLDIDFGDADADTGKAPALDVGELDLDLGTEEKAAEADADDWQSTQRIDPSMLDDTQIQKDLEPVTMSEVGTKLDLARAYMDMGDPDGARSILNEVLQEGSEGQRKEAQRLLDSIPG